MVTDFGVRICTNRKRKELEQPFLACKTDGRKKSFSVLTDVEQSPKGRENKNQGVCVRSCVFFECKHPIKICCSRNFSKCGIHE